MFRFENIEFLWGLLLIPLMVFVYLLVRNWRKKALSKYAEPHLLQALIPDLTRRKHLLKLLLFASAYLLLVVAIANPQIGSKLEEVKREGVDLMIALDVSNSMRAEDLSPNRLERSKRAIEKLIEQLHNDRIGLIVFAGQAFVQLPITSDYAAAKLFASTISTDIVPVQGTAIGAAINEAITALSKDDSKSKALIIMTDGENHEDDALEAAKKAAERGITVHTIGMGSVKGAPIPLYRNGVKTGFRTDNQGNTVISKLNPSMLQQLAQAGNGTYVRATNAQSGLEAVLGEINEMEKMEYESRIYTDYEDRFQPFLIGALILLIIEFFISSRRSKWIKKINLFGTEK